MSDKEFLVQVKRILKQVPGAQSLNKIRLNIIKVRELSHLIKENRVVVFNPYSRMENDAALVRAMAREIVKERVDLYGTVRLRKTMATAKGFPAGAIFLYSPLALLRIPSTHEEYMKGVKHDIRRKIRVAWRQGYEFKEFAWDDHLDEIYEINISKAIRQSEPMRGWYREPVQPRYHSKEELQYYKYYGAFKEGKLYAYLHFCLFGDLAISRHFIGHAQHLRFGIMNGLISYTVQECIENLQVKWLYYGDWQKNQSLTMFKRQAGFRACTILLDLDGDSELLKYSEQKVRTIWRL